MSINLGDSAMISFPITCKAAIMEGNIILKVNSIS